MLKARAAQQPCHCFGYGIDYQGVRVLPSSPEEPFLRLELDGKIIRSSLVGAYNATNVLAAIAVGDYFGVPREEAIAAVESFCPDNKRSEMRRTQSNTLVVDAYNANPSSMEAALDNFVLMQAERKLVLLGEMRELGEESLREHVKLVRRIAALPLKSMLVGEEFRKALDECGCDYIVADSCASGDADFVWAPDSSVLADYLSRNPVRGSLVLVKGSRGTLMERTLPQL